MIWPYVHDVLKDAHSGSLGFVVGNGCSRQGLDLSSLHEYGIVVACNRAFEDVKAHYVVAQDPPAARVVWKADQSPLITNCQLCLPRTNPLFRFRNMLWNEKTINDEPLCLDKHFIPGLTGVTALQVSILMGCNPIVLIGLEHAIPSPTKNSVFVGKGYEEYPDVNYAPHAVVRTPVGIIPKHWSHAVVRLWWLLYTFGRRVSFFRLFEDGVFQFIPWVGENECHEFPPPPTLRADEFVKFLGSGKLRPRNPSYGFASAQSRFSGSSFHKLISNLSDDGSTSRGLKTGSNGS